jgi:hypothetical protein
VPIILGSLVVAAALEGSGWRARLLRDRWLVGVTGAISLVGAVAVLLDSSLLGFYGTISESLSLSGVPDATGEQALAFIAMSGFVPFLLVGAVSLERRAWEDRELRVLLVALWVALLGFLLLTGLTLPRLPAGVTWSIQRYVEYPLPLLFVAMLAGVLRLTPSLRSIAIVTAVVAGGFLLGPDVGNVQEQRGMYGVTHRLGEPLGLSGPVSLAVATVLCGAVIAVLIALRERRADAVRLLALGALAATAVVFLVQNQAGWSWQREQAQGWRANFPDDLDWIDRAAEAPVARLVGAVNPYRNAVTDFFNADIEQVYVPDAPVPGPSIQGRTCTWAPSSAGVPEFQPGCGPEPSRFLLNDDQAKFTFYGQRVLADEPGVGRVVDVAPQGLERTRLKALVQPPCIAPIATSDPRTGEISPTRTFCSPSTRGRLWLDEPGTVKLRFRGGEFPQQVQVVSTERPEPRIVAIPEGRDTTVEIPVGTGAQEFALNFDWPAGYLSSEVPELEAMTLVQDGGRTELLY